MGVRYNKSYTVDIIVERDKRRRFNRKEKLSSWLYQDGKSAISGIPLDPTKMHADHRTPHSKGGLTVIENCDVVTPRENLIKGSKMSEDNRFKWQDEFIQIYTQHSEPNFLLCALPAAGKTKASIRAIRNWIAEGGVIVVAAPTRPIRRMWRNRLKEAGIFIDDNSYGYVREKYNGIAVTYAGLHSLVGAFKKLCSSKPVLLVCDEIHHASEDENSVWGTDLREAFGLAKRRLLLTGTPVRSDKETTSFLEIENDSEEPGKYQYKMHYKYDWPRALEDRVVRSISFPRVGMSQVEVDFIKKGKKVLFNDDESYLSYALDHRKFLFSTLMKANQTLDELRRSDNTAAAMAIGMNIAHARTLYEQLQLLGQDPIIVTSDEEESSLDIIDEFAKEDNSKRWIVSVKQVSEGVDIPRLRVLAYLTNYTTDLAFRQFVGRVARRRARESNDEATAYVFIPEVPKLVSMAEKIEKLQKLALKKPPPKTSEPPERPDIGITVGGTEPEFVGYIIHGKHYIGDRATVIQQLMKKYKIGAESASIMINDPDFAQGFKSGEEPLESQTQEPPWIEEAQLKSECKELTTQLVEIRKRRRGHTGYDRRVYERLVTEVNIEFMIDGLKTKMMSISQLRRKKQALLETIMKEEQF